MAATGEKNAIFSVLEFMLIRGERWRLHGRQVAKTVLAAVQSQFTPLKRTDLSYLSHRNIGMFPPECMLYVVPPRREHSAVTAVWCQWDFNADVPKCGFYFGIWSEQDALPNPVDGKFTAFLGFRYETPEEGHNHDYYHAQPCQSMGNREVVAHAVPVSTRYPTFPLAATSSLELLLCFFVSIYGMDGLTALRRGVSANPLRRRNQLLHRSIDVVVGRLRGA